MLFIVGSPRSGTTWLQRLLSCHPLVATGQETNLFDGYIAPQLRVWRRDMAEGEGRVVGLGCHLTEEEFMTALTQYIDALLAPMRARTPEGGIFVEKTPSHATCMREIAELLPEARFIHVLRDVRETVASMRAASESWGAGWAPRDVRAAASVWTRHVNMGLAAGRELGDGRYAEVRYEALVEDASRELERLVCGFMGLSWSREDIVTAVEMNRVRKGLNGKNVSAVPLPLYGEWGQRMEMKTLPEPEGFVGEQLPRLGPFERLRVWRVARRAMGRAGYRWVYPWA